MEKTITAEMEVDEVAAGEKTFIGLPEVVFMDGLFPLLDNNQLLRLRRVNKGLKKMTDRYLRSHAPSKRTIKLNLADVSGESSLSQFLEEDRNNSIKMPLSVVVLKYSDADLTYPDEEDEGEDAVDAEWSRKLQTPEMDDFLLKYGNQIRFLTIRQLTLPIERGSAQFQLFERMPNLQKLHILFLKSPLSSKVEVPVDTAAAGDELPNCFKITLKQLKVDYFLAHEDDDIGKNRLWKLVVQLKNLETFKHPFNFYKESEVGEFPSPWSSLLENLNKIVKHKKLRSIRWIFPPSSTILTILNMSLLSPQNLLTCV